jgi:hypothetical protein
MADALPTSQANAIRSLPNPPYRGTGLPDIDYDAHPAYGGTFPQATLGERLYALKIFAKSFAFVTIRRLVDYENMPLLSKAAAAWTSQGRFATSRCSPAFVSAAGCAR